MKRVLSLDGGGCKGIIQLAILEQIENNLGIPIHSTFDLIVGSSVGSIIGGVLSATNLTATKFMSSMMDALPEIFGPRPHIPIVQPKYDRKDVVSFLREYISPESGMKICKTKFLCSSVNIVDAKTHFFKSWEDKDGDLNFIEALNRSYAAPYFFGAMVDKKSNSVWLDGGTGNQNCPLIETRIELARQGWTNERVHILSLGAGQTDAGVPFNSAKFYGTILQALFYTRPADGGLARIQNVGSQVELFKSEVIAHPNISFQRLDILNMAKKINKLDGAKYRHVYKRIGEDLANKVDYKLFKE